MESFHAMGLMIGSDANDIARAIGKAPVTVQKYKEDPLMSGSRNPCDTLRMMIEASLKLGRDRNDALAPVRYLLDQFPVETPAMVQCVNSAHADLFESFGRLIQEHTQAMRDGVISPLERARICREVHYLRCFLDEYDFAVAASSREKAHGR